jgi:hypothetical protein
MARTGTVMLASGHQKNAEALLLMLLKVQEVDSHFHLMRRCFEHGGNLSLHLEEIALAGKGEKDQQDIALALIERGVFQFAVLDAASGPGDVNDPAGFDPGVENILDIHGGRVIAGNAYFLAIIMAYIQLYKKIGFAVRTLEGEISFGRGALHVFMLESTVRTGNFHQNSRVNRNGFHSSVFCSFVMISSLYSTRKAHFCKLIKEDWTCPTLLEFSFCRNIESKGTVILLRRDRNEEGLASNEKSSADEKSPKVPESSEARKGKEMGLFLWQWKS